RAGGRSSPRRRLAARKAAECSGRGKCPSRIGASSSGLCVAVEIPRGGWRRDFQRVWEGPGVGVWWPGAFHTRSDSTARAGGRFGSELPAVLRGGWRNVCQIDVNTEARYYTVAAGQEAFLDLIYLDQKMPEFAKFTGGTDGCGPGGCGCLLMI